MPKLSDIIGTTPTTPGSGTSSVEVTALKNRVTALENKPAFNPKTIEDAIAVLVANEKVDDAAVEALEKAFKALPTIDLTPYAKTADIKPYDDTQVKANLKTLEDGAAKIAKDLTDAIALLNAADSKRIIGVVRDHKPTDAEIGDPNNPWHIWQSQIPDPPNAKVNFFLWIPDGNYAQQLLAEDTVVPWEALARYDPIRKTYNLAVEGVAFEYNKTPISSLGNQHFGSPSLVFVFKDANTVFSSINYKAFNVNGTEIGNGGSTAVSVDTLTVIQVNPAMAGGESTVVAKVIFEFTKLDGSKLPYEVKI